MMARKLTVYDYQGWILAPNTNINPVIQPSSTEKLLSSSMNSAGCGCPGQL